MTGQPVNTNEEPTSSTLLAAAKARDVTAWQRLTGLYGPLIYGWCRQNRLQEADAADVTQEVLTVVVSKLGEFRRDRPGDTFRGWLRTIARNKIRDLKRSERAGLRGEGGSSALLRWLRLTISEFSGRSESSSLVDRNRELSEEIERIRLEFTERDWEIFCRLTLCEETPADVACELGTSVNVVYLVKSRILKRLRHQED